MRYMTTEDVMPLVWAKSDAGGHPHSLIGHLLDTAAVAEIIWDEFMAPITKHLLNLACDGRGRETYVLICGLHDIGKASPEFQRKCPDLAAPLREHLPIKLSAAGTDKEWHHTRSGSLFLEHLLDDRFPETIDSREHWVEAIVLGHHGRITEIPHRRPRKQHDEARWEPLQEAFAERLAHETGSPLSALITSAPPSQSLQLELAGYVVMADWIASSSEFPGIGLRDESMAEARRRARRAWEHLGFSPSWRSEDLTDSIAAFPDQFGFAPRPLQQMAAEVARSIPEPGLMIIEAPMGEGKTEAGEFAAEVLARRFGCNGFVFAMPTQGTTDSMFQRVLRWNEQVAPDVPVTLLHGKAMLNETWFNMLRQDTDELSDIYGDGEDDPYGLSQDTGQRQVGAPAAWLLGRHRQLLSPLVVGTVDQVLRAAVRSKFIMLRHAGLAGKVVIIDEVHSYDVYMSVFLHELLHWCAGAHIPVVLMSATLPPDLRNELITSYAGAAEKLTPSEDYPIITSALADGATSSVSCLPYRKDMEVAIEVLDTDDPSDISPIVDAVDIACSEGGCALVIMNTVKRAQAAYRHLKARGIPAVILHGRLTTSARADRTADVVSLLGADRHIGSGRPDRLVVVATQIAEQSFDVDADILFSDVAPVDLILQRVGRLHRHTRPADDRPRKLRVPRMVITGLKLADDQEPEWPKAFEYVYARWTLLAAAHELQGHAASWMIPNCIPRLVASAYGTAWERDTAWSSVADARTDQESRRSGRTGIAGTYLLGGNLTPGVNTLEGLHYQEAADDDDHSTVRDGEPTREVCLVVRRDDGYFSLDGHSLGPNGERCSDPALARHVLGDCVRVRESEPLGDLRPLPAWSDIPLLAWQDTLILGTDQSARFPGVTVHYDDEFGLVIDHDGR